MSLKKVAFVAMPYGIKSTGIGTSPGPAQVDFDALWLRAFVPALEELGYLPMRADRQPGSVIVKAMLEQLVHADLVLADISIPNGNVYYEAGVRHAAQERGCILLSADWSRPLFDLQQITQLRYPGPLETPTADSYRAIMATLIDGIPKLADLSGPVHQLVTSPAKSGTSSRDLTEMATSVFQFRSRLREAQLKAEVGDKEPLRSLARDESLKNLPSYALHGIVDAVSDYLHWDELLQLVDGLPESVRGTDPFFNEHKGHALSKLGQPTQAVALLETIIEAHGETPQRLGTLGSRYREMAREEGSRALRRKYLGKAIDTYRRGKLLDLNHYYCAYKLLVVLVERGREDDREEIDACASAVRAAVERAQCLSLREEWMLPAETALAFHDMRFKEARDLIDQILDSGWSNWKLVGLVLDLEVLAKSIRERAEPALISIVEEALADLHADLPVPQSRLCSEVLPALKKENSKYEKFQTVHARQATPGEVVVSVTSDGEETSNQAEAGSYVVRNLTEAQELYLVGGQTFTDRYTYAREIDESWSEYAPKGEVLAMEITHQWTQEFDVGEEFFIEAPWKAEQLAREGDMLVSPLPKLEEVYRIARKEFHETYRRVETEARDQDDQQPRA